MKGYIIDSDTWIEYFHQRSGVGAHISQVPRNEIFASEVSIAELTYGALHSSNVEKHMKEPMIIKKYFIGVTARHYGLTVVTHNIKHFSKMPGVNCVDWVESK